MALRAAQFLKKFLMRKIFVCCIVVFSLHSISFGQDSLICNANRFEDDLLNKLVGDWDLTGKIGTRPAENHFSAQWILNHQFIEMNFVDVVSPPRYMAKVSIGFDCISERYVVHWMDILGGRISETMRFGIRKGDHIEFRFEYPDGPFINDFSYDNIIDGWHFHMTQKNAKGVWVVFGDEYLKRKK
jgi:hypothetical protein